VCLKSLQTYLVVARNTTLQKWLRAVVYCLIYILTHWFLLNNLNITNLFLSILISRIKRWWWNWTVDISDTALAICCATRWTRLYLSCPDKTRTHEFLDRVDRWITHNILLRMRLALWQSNIKKWVKFVTVVTFARIQLPFHAYTQVEGRNYTTTVTNV
jgi:hypothetical protein